MGRIITIGNRKGGSGKTTTAVCLAAGLAHRGRRVLLVDLDPQAHATLSLGVRQATIAGTYAVLAEGKQVSESVLHTGPGTLDLLPAVRRLTEYERLFTPVKEARMRLAHALRPVRPAYDFVLFDTPPTLGLLTASALIASDELVIPMQAHYLALDGLAEMMRMVATINRIYGTRLRIRGIVPTLHQERARLSRAVLEEVRAHLGAGAILHPVRTSIALAEAPSHGRTIYAHDPRCTGAMDYLAVVAELDGGAAASPPEAESADPQVRAPQQPTAQGRSSPAVRSFGGGEHGQEG